MVLQVGQFLHQFMDAVVIYDCDRSNRFFILIPLLLHQVVSYQVPQRFGAIGVLFSLDVLIELLEKGFMDRNTKPNYFWHWFLF